MAKQTKAPRAPQPAAVQPVTLSATPCAASNASQPPLNLGKYAKQAAVYGVGNMGSAASAMFKLGAWPQSTRAKHPPAPGVTPSVATVQQAMWLAAVAAGATATKAVSGLAIGRAVVTPGTVANGALCASNSAMQPVKGQLYAKNGQPCGQWLNGYIGPHKSAACVASGALVPVAAA